MKENELLAVCLSLNSSMEASLTISIGLFLLLNKVNFVKRQKEIKKNAFKFLIVCKIC